MFKNQVKPTLLVLAAGMGSRYGGLKQIDPVGPNGETIIEYSLYDAISAGFAKIVFVIRKSFQEAFKNMIGDKLDCKAEVKYVYQELDACLGNFELPGCRQKPWGTGHAILVAADVINEPFAVINADDFYGGNSYKVIARYLSEPSEKNDYCMVGYTLNNTLSEHGSVSRGVCRCNDNMKLQKIVEHTRIHKVNNKIVCLDNKDGEKTLTGSEVVSMNLWGFRPSIFDHLKSLFAEFLVEKGTADKSEFYIPFAVDSLINDNLSSVKVLTSKANWFGVTFPEDKPAVVAKIKELVDSGNYPSKLWQNKR